MIQLVESIPAAYASGEPFAPVGSVTFQPFPAQRRSPDSGGRAQRRHCLARRRRGRVHALDDPRSPAATGILNPTLTGSTGASLIISLTRATATRAGTAYLLLGD